MKKIEALQILQKTSKRIFRASDLRKLLDIKNSGALNKQVSGLIEAGILARIAKGSYYLTSNKPLDFELANALYQPSCISLESALNYYGILVQSPHQITSVTPKLTKHIDRGGKTYSYSHLTQKYFDGYQMVNGFLIATPEKALIDTIFFTALGKTSLSVNELDLDSSDKARVEEIASRVTNRAFKKYFTSVIKLRFL